MPIPEEIAAEEYDMLAEELAETIPEAELATATAQQVVNFFKDRIKSRFQQRQWLRPDRS